MPDGIKLLIKEYKICKIKKNLQIFNIIYFPYIGVFLLQH